MIKTLITRITILKQYNSENKTILWEDPASSRWDNIYGKLVENDNAIFISSDKLLIGTISKVNIGKSLLCVNIKEVHCQNDQFLRLHAAYPELISRVKANFQPFIHPLQLDINQIISDAKIQNFINFYILSGEEKYNDLFQSFKENDRIVLLSNNGKFENVKLSSNQGLIDFQTKLNINISVKGQTIDEVLQKNKSYKRKSTRSNNVTRIEKIKNDTITNGLFKFTSFFTYYDTLINKSVYDKVEKSDSNIKTIYLNPNETIFKVSMSGKDINDESFTFFNDNNLIIVHSHTKAKGVSLQTQSDTFGKQMKIGDYFYMCRGNSNLEIIGRIISDANPCEYKDFGSHGWLQRSYEIISEAIKEESYTDDKKWWTPNDNSTCIVIPSKEINEANTKLFIPFFNTQFEPKTTPLITTIHENKIMSKNLNQILYGPPGTGKTFNSINRALEIINEEEEQKLNWEDRKAVKNLFNKRVDEGRIVFTTFHQSMSYEDFIEGIKPKIDEDVKENKQVIYEVENGIFKRLVDNAQKKRTASKEVIEKYNFDDAWDDLINKAERNLEENDPLFLSIQTPNLGLKIIEISERGNLKLKPIYSTDSKEYTVSFLRAKKLQEVYPDLSVIKNIDKEFRAVIGGSNSTAYWSVLNYINQKINNNSKILKQENELPPIPYILIIDEINRGNVSAIFGELITLIEEDKRMGAEESLEVILPYSKEKFGVPSNLYIIGTMNTADRSVEALDSALRRRFCFEEMPPLYVLDELKNDIFGYKASEILKTINSRIEKLIDKDHAIGHSYLLNKDKNSIVDSFYKNIIPLLQEYFFGDYSKIGLVLGKGFVHLKEWDRGTDAFADFDDDISNDFDNKNVYQIIDYKKVKNYKLVINKVEIVMDFEKAIKVLMKDNIE